MPGLLDDYNTSSDYIKQLMDNASRMGYLGDQVRDPRSAQNQFLLRNLSSQFNSSQPNYFEIAASQGYGGAGGGLAGMQQLAARRQAGLLTNANFGQMMNENQKTALGYYNQGSQYAQSGMQGQTGLLNLDYQDKWRKDELEEQKRQFNEQQGGFWGDLLNVGLGIAGSFAGGLGGSLGKKWFR